MRVLLLFIFNCLLFVTGYGESSRRLRRKFLKDIEDGDETLWQEHHLNTGQPGRQGHSSIFLQDDSKMISIFGCYLAVECYNDVSLLDTSTWQQESVIIHGSPPTVRGGQTIVTFLNTLVVFGGSSNIYGFLNDVSVLYTRPEKKVEYGDEIHMTWSYPEIHIDDDSMNKKYPLGRESHTAIIMDKLMVILGGNEPNGVVSLLDILYLNLEEMKWYRREAIYLTSDPDVASMEDEEKKKYLSRIGHSCVSLDNGKNILIFGGRDSMGNVINTGLILDVTLWEWRDVHFRGKSPLPRQDHSVLQVGSSMFIFGGCDYAAQICYNDVYVLDLLSLVWKEVEIAGMKPDARGASSLLLSPTGNLVVYNGCHLGLTCFNDVWELFTSEVTPFCQEKDEDSCNGHGICRNNKCMCEDYYSGPECGEETVCIACDHGKCMTDGLCRCDAGFKGPTCSSEVKCMHQCNGRGTCVTSDICKCNDGWSGKYCTFCEPKVEEEVDDGKGEAACTAHGSCVALLPTEMDLYYPPGDQGSFPIESEDGTGPKLVRGKCTCESGWGGELCSFDLSASITPPTLPTFVPTTTTTLPPTTTAVEENGDAGSVTTGAPAIEAPAFKETNKIIEKRMNAKDIEQANVLAPEQDAVGQAMQEIQQPVLLVPLILLILAGLLITLFCALPNCGCCKKDKKIM